LLLTQCSHRRRAARRLLRHAAWRGAASAQQRNTLRCTRTAQPQPPYSRPKPARRLASRESRWSSVAEAPVRTPPALRPRLSSTPAPPRRAAAPARRAQWCARRRRAARQPWATPPRRAACAPRQAPAACPAAACRRGAWPTPSPPPLGALPPPPPRTGSTQPQQRACAPRRQRWQPW
jgi:hypothetical protein